MTRSRLGLALALATVLLGKSRPLGAQDVVVGDAIEDYARVLQLLGRARPGPMLLRPLATPQMLRMDSAGHPWAGRLEARVGRVGAIRYGVGDLETRAYVNSAHPVVANDGLVWQGKGTSLYVTAGGWARVGPVTATFRPEFAYAGNAAFATLPVADTGLSPFADAWYGAALDRPQRFGAGGYDQWSLGQSSIRVDARGFAAGVTTANAWWGPGQRQAILLSNSAPGFPRVFLGTGRPVDIGIGRIEFTWFWGGLRESGFFDQSDSNDTKYVTALAFDLEVDPVPGLYVGGARLFYLDWPSRGIRAGDLFLPLQGITKSSQVTPENPSGNDNRDQLLSLFARWVFPASGFEVYGEWARNDHAGTLRDFVLQPEHSQGYTFGLQKAWAFDGRSILRARAELIHLEQSKTLLARATPTYYVHSIVSGGFTNRGQVVGAAIGPGGDGQFVGVDWFHRRGSVGGFVRRDVHDNDTYYRLVRSNAIPGFPPINDVELTVGGQARLFLGAVALSATLAVGREWNRDYQERNDQTNLHAELGVHWMPGGR